MSVDTVADPPRHHTNVTLVVHLETQDDLAPVPPSFDVLRNSKVSLRVFRQYLNLTLMPFRNKRIFAFTTNDKSK